MDNLVRGRGLVLALAKSRARELRLNQTRAEKIFWIAVRDRKFCSLKFVRQHPLFFTKGRGQSFYIADFYCHELKLVIELDGTIHKFRRFEDGVRDEILSNSG